MLSYGLDETISTNTAVETGSVEDGNASQTWRDVHLLDNRQSLLKRCDMAESLNSKAI